MISRVLPKSFALRGKTRVFATVAAEAAQDIKPFSEIPHIPEVPILGAGWNYIPGIGKYKLLRMHHGNLAKYLQYGPIVRESLNRDVTVIHLYEYDDIEKVFRQEGRYPFRQNLQIINHYRKSRSDIYKNGGVIATNGHEWQEARAEIQVHMMKPKTIHNYLGAMDSVSLQFLERIRHVRSGNGGEVHDTLDELYKWALESVGVVALDTHLGCLEIKPNEEATRLIRAVGEIFLHMMKLEFGIFPLWKYFSTPMYRKYTKNMDFFSHTVQKYLKQAQDRLKTVSEEHEATFLERMLSETKDYRTVTTTITDMFLAGIDTTSTTVGMTLYHLARNPDIQEKAYQEIKSALQGKELNIQTLNEVRYLKACVKESMRLTPVVFGNTRNTTEDMVLRGYRIPAGTQMTLENMVSSRMEKNFENAMKYIPDRFLRNETKHHPFAYIPFGFGPRSCVGRRIAEQEIWTLLIRVLERYRVEYHHEEIDMITRLINTPDKPLRFKFFDR